MNTEFCINCGNQFEYTLNRPKFCSACGSSLDSANSSPPSESLASAEVEPEVIPGGLPNISKLEYSISNNQNTLTFGDLVSQASNDPNASYQKIGARPSPPATTADEAIKQTLKQCRSAREPSDVGGE